jgi:hypothetical protein
MPTGKITIDIQVNPDSFKYFPVRIGAGKRWAVYYEFTILANGTEHVMRQIVTDDIEGNTITAFDSEAACLEALKELTQ